MKVRPVDANALKVVLLKIANNMQNSGYTSYAGAMGEAANIVEHRRTLDYEPVRSGRWEKK